MKEKHLIFLLAFLFCATFLGAQAIVRSGWTTTADSEVAKDALGITDAVATTNIIATNVYATNIYVSTLITTNIFVTEVKAGKVTVTTNLFVNTTYVTNLFAESFWRTNRSTILASNTTWVELNYSGTTDWYEIRNLGETNVVFSPTNLVEGREISLFLRAANNDYDITITNIDGVTVYWPLEQSTNGSTSLTVTNGQGLEVSLVCITNSLWARYGRSR